jgi:hypothetical protein
MQAFDSNSTAYSKSSVTRRVQLVQSVFTHYFTAYSTSTIATTLYTAVS